MHVVNSRKAVLVMWAFLLCTLLPALPGYGVPVPCAARIGDYVWFDADRDGIQDVDETGIEGVTVILTSTDWGFSVSTTTDGNGYYLFEGQCDGNYSVAVDETTVPDGYVPTIVNAVGSTPEDDSDDPTGTPVSLPNYDSENLTIDFGYTTVPCYECDGKVTELTLEYAPVAGSTDPVTVLVAQKKDGVVFEAVVAPGEQFVLLGQDKKGTLGTEIKIYINGALNAKIHTSCSQPIGPGLVSGDFVVIEGYSRNGGRLCPLPPVPPQEPDCECDGKVTQLTLQYLAPAGCPSPDAYVEVYQKKGGIVFAGTVTSGQPFTFVGADKKGTLGTEIAVSVDGALNTKIHTSCSQPIGPGLVSGNFLVVDGYSRNGGQLCPLPPTPPTPPGADECECDGKVTQLTLEYTPVDPAATDPVGVYVVQKKGGAVFDDIVAPGEQFSLVGVDKKGTLSTEIKIYINGTLNTEIHTSCSQPIGPGLVSGDFLVIDGYSRNNGQLCPLP